MADYETVQKQFAKTAQAYVHSAIHAKGNDLAQMLEVVGEVQGKRALDIATGGGHTALALARAGAKVVATDLTPEMLQAAQGFIASQEDAASLEVEFQTAKAEDLPFEAGSFDLVSCRIAAHHFLNPQKFVAEVARVLKPAGRFALIDNIAPEKPDLAQAMNQIEKVRDPSHNQAYSVRQWVDLLANAGLEVYQLSRWRRKKDFAAWVVASQTPATTVEDLERWVLALGAPQKAYLEVEEQEDKLLSLSHEVVFIAAQREAI